eukprot:COSAG06_NODE_12646_length_1348_cov_1.492394_1_plen_71_part_10
MFVLEEMKSPALREWVQAQHMVGSAVTEASAELSEADAALKIQSGFRGGAARKEVAEKKREEQKRKEKKKR